MQARETCGYSFFGCRRCSKVQVVDRNCVASSGEQKVYKTRRSDASPKIIAYSSVISSIIFKNALHASMMDASRNVRCCSYHHGSSSHTLSRACASVFFALLTERLKCFAVSVSGCSVSPVCGHGFFREDICFHYSFTTPLCSIHGIIQPLLPSVQFIQSFPVFVFPFNPSVGASSEHEHGS